jgi:predicted regulator of Ras-like GTPase activity (Roadblock/LC7/MglB family)
MSRLDAKVAELKSITGCLGGFVSREGVAFASSLPPVYDQTRLDRVAINVRKVAAVAEKAGYPGADLVLRYGKANLVVLALGDGAFLTLACEPSASVATIEMFASVAADDIREALAARLAAPPPPPPPPAPEPEPHALEPVVVPPPSPAARLEEARQTALALYGAPLGSVKALFISEVGPIGDLLFKSALDAWILGGPIDWQRAGELREVLAAEIDDAKSRARFSQHGVWSNTSR